MPSRVFLRALTSAPAPRAARVRRLLSVGLLTAALLLSSTVPAGAAEAEKEDGTRSALHAFLEAVGQLGARLAVGNDLPAHVAAGRAAPGTGTVERAAATRIVTGTGREAGKDTGKDTVPTVPASKDENGRKAKKKACRHAGDGEVPKVVAAIFRCHLRKAGFSEAEVGQFVAEAVVVSKCESYWDPNIVVFDGKYLHQPHPRTGYRYSAAGVFQFIRATADKWIDGGYANVKKPRLNIDAAARLFIHNRTRGFKGWEDWACAVANDGFKHGSVLPNYPGGPSAMPDWSWKY